MELKFNKSEEGWVAEFKVTSTFSLHIEGVVEGNISVHQRTTASGEYAYTREGTPSKSYGKVYEFDFPVLVGPKFIKVVCATEPTSAEVVTDGEVAFEGGGEEQEILDVLYYFADSSVTGYIKLSEIEDIEEIFGRQMVSWINDSTVEISVSSLNWAEFYIYGYVLEYTDIHGNKEYYPKTMRFSPYFSANYDYGNRCIEVVMGSGLTVRITNYDN